MSVKLGEAVVYLLGDKEGIEGSLEDTEKKTTGWAQGLAGKVQGLLGTALKVGVAGAAAAIVGLGVAAFDAGMQMDEAMDTIAISTGATGEALEGLGDDFKAVFTSIPTEAGPAADVISELNKRLGLTGESLQDTAKPLLEMTRLLGGDAKNNTALFTRVMGDWSIQNEDTGATLDKIFKASQLTGVGVESLMQKVVAFGSPLRLMGFSLDESIAMFGKWEKEGVNAELVMGSLKIAAAKFADAGVPLQQGLQDTITQIKGMDDASAALALGMSVFGARAGPDMVAAIREGRFEIGDLVTALGGAEGAIMDAADATADFPEQMQKFKNVATTVLAPLGAALMGIATTLLTTLGPAVLQVAAWAGPAFESLGTAVSMVFDTIRGTGGDIPWEDILPSWLAPIMYEISDLFMRLGGTVTDFIRYLQGGDSVIAAFGGAMANWVGLGGVFDSLAGAIFPVLDALQASLPAIGGAFSSLGGVVQTALGIIMGLVQQLAPIFANIFVTQMQTALSVATTVWGTISGIISTVVPTIITLLGMIGERAVPVLVQAFSMIQTIISDVAAFVVPLVAQISTFIQEQFATVVGWVQANMPLIQATMDAVFNGIKIGLGVLLQVWNTVWPVMQVVVTTAFDVIKVAIQTAIDVILGIVKLGMQLITGDWEGAWASFKGIIETALGGVLKIVQTLLADVGSAIGGQVGAFIQAGADLIGGLIKGLQDNAGKVMDTLLNAVKGGVNAVKSFFGIKSPSKLMIQMGEDLMGGLTIGIETEGADAVSAMKKVVVDMAKMMKDLASAFHQMNKVEKDEGGLPNLQLWAEALKRSVVLFAGALAEAAKEVGSKALSKAKELTGKMERLFEMISGFAKLLVELAVVERIPDFAPFATVLQSAIILLTTALNNAALTLGTKAIEAAAALSSSAADILGLVEPGVRAITALVKVTVEELTGSEGKWPVLQAGILFIVSSLAATAVTLDQSGYPAAVSFSESAGKILALVEPAIRTILAITATALEDLKLSGEKWSWIATAILYIVGNLVTLTANLDQSGYPAAVAFSESAGKIISLVEPAVNMVLGLTGVKVEDLQGFGERWSWVATAIFYIANQVTLMAGRLGTDVLQAAERFRHVTTDINEAIKAGLGTLSDVAGGAGPETVAGVLEGFAVSVVASLQAAADGAQKGLRNLVAIIRPIPGQIRDIFAEFDWAGIGISITEGIARGISAGAGAITKAAKQAAQAALRAAKEELGIASPSSVMRLEVGQQAGMGVALGVEDMIPRIREAMTDLTGQLGAGGAPYGATTSGLEGMASEVDLGQTNGLLGQILANLRALVAGVQALQPSPTLDARGLARQLEFEARMS